MIHHLPQGAKRFSDLRRAMPGISQRMLTRDLRELESAGLLTRTVLAEVPVRVEYEPTAQGKRLRPVIEELCAWGKELRRASAFARA